MINSTWNSNVLPIATYAYHRCALYCLCISASCSWASLSVWDFTAEPFSHFPGQYWSVSQRKRGHRPENHPEDTWDLVVTGATLSHTLGPTTCMYILRTTVLTPTSLYITQTGSYATLCDWNVYCNWSKEHIMNWNRYFDLLPSSGS